MNKYYKPAKLILALFFLLNSFYTISFAEKSSISGSVKDAQSFCRKRS